LIEHAGYGAGDAGAHEDDVHAGEHGTVEGGEGGGLDFFEEV
jgi:hypothetical protein